MSLSEKTTSTSFLQSILDCSLVRIHGNHFTGPNAKNVLIIFDGLSRLKINKSFDCPFEVLRNILATGKIVDNNGIEIHFSSIYFLAEFSTSEKNPDFLKIPPRLKKFIFPWFWNNSQASFAFLKTI